MTETDFYLKDKSKLQQAALGMCSATDNVRYVEFSSGRQYYHLLKQGATVVLDMRQKAEGERDVTIICEARRVSEAKSALEKMIGTKLIEL